MEIKPEQNPIIEKENTNQDLRTKFFAMFDRMSIPEKDIEAVFQTLASEYSKPERFYHTLEHVRSVLRFIEERADQIQDRRSVELAVWFHDAVYDSKDRDNEEKSAALARSELTKLSVPEEIIQRVELLVRATRKHQLPAEDADGAIFLDSDLSILGADQMEYDAYAEAIRNEFAWLSEDAYREGRKAFLERFLSRGRLFKSDAAYNQLQQKARDNMQREIAKLS